MRGIAILGVVAYHVGLPWATGGFTGVDVFFVVSGFLITQLLLKEARSTGNVSISGFYARRVRRLLPALTTVLAVSLVAGSLFLPAFGEKQELATSAIAATFFAANQYFLASTSGYFDAPAGMKPLLHLWSLSVEEQFYLVWPLIIIVAARRSRREALVGNIRFVIGTLLAGSFLLSWWLVRTHPATAFFTLPARAWELGVGALLATIPSGGSHPFRLFSASAAGWLGAGLIAIGFFAFSGATPFPGPSAAVPVVGSALLIYAGMASPGNVVSRSLAAKPLVAVGLVSYSWYLWHWPLLSIVRNRRLSESDVPADCALVLIALGLAAFTVRFIENPFRHHKGVPVSVRKVLTLGLAALVAVLGLAGVVGAWAKYGPKSPYVPLAEREHPPLQSVCMLAVDNWDGRIFRHECDEVPPGRASENLPLVVVWGDSHADAWAPAVRVNAEEEGVETWELSFASCPPLLDLTISTGEGPLVRCRGYNTQILLGLRQMREEHPNRRIGAVLAARWEGYMGTLPIPVRDRAPMYPMFYSDRRGGVAENQEALRNGLRRTLTSLQELGISVVIMLPGPEFRIAPVRCASFGYDTGQCREPLEEMEAYRKASVDAVMQVAGGFPNVRVLDPLPFFCPREACLGFAAGQPVVYDDNHTSVSAAKAFAPVMREDFRWLIGNR